MEEIEKNVMCISSLTQNCIDSSKQRYDMKNYKNKKKFNKLLRGLKKLCVYIMRLFYQMPRVDSQISSLVSKNKLFQLFLQRNKMMI
jgi:hypothetical protein